MSDYALVRDWLAPLCPPATPPAPTEWRCAVLDWAASGAMALTGHLDQPPVASPAPAFGLLSEMVRVLARLTGRIGIPVQADPAAILAGRAGLLGLSRAGRTSAGGTTRLLRGKEGWCAVTLSRPTDLDAVPAILAADVPGNPWEALAVAAHRTPREELVARCQLLGVPAATLPPPMAPNADPAAPFRISRLARPGTAAGLDGALVADLSAMWAGPLCAHLLGRAGARVVKVESLSRPDGARRGDPRFFDWLHAGHEQISLDFATAAGRADLAALLAEADVVIEASRPRALAQLGLAPATRPHRPGQVWLSITGYGRAAPELVAFGDDAAVAGGLVGWHAGEPVFCADAIADPLTGVCGALAVVAALLDGGGSLIDLSMRATATAFAAVLSGRAERHGPHAVYRNGSDWWVRCPWLRRDQPVLPPPVPETPKAAVPC